MGSSSMHDRALREEIRRCVVAAGADDPGAAAPRPVGGGSINEAWRFGDGAAAVFVKVNDASRADMFAAEEEGLRELAAAAAVRVPAPLCTGVCGDRAFIALEWIDLHSGDARAAARLGANLAALHATCAGEYGWHRDNTIGTTPQRNGPDRDWVSFFARNRLGAQLDLAASRAGTSRLVDRGRRLQQSLAGLFDDPAPAAALLHGDLWGGNWAATPSGEPVLFDPAVYYGDPETDIAMTELFGGFGAAFYGAYREVSPEPADGERRRRLYRLYHVLNHFNLFGGGYGRQAEALIEGLLAEV